MEKCGKGERLKFTDIVTSNSQGSTLVVRSKADPSLPGVRRPNGLLRVGLESWWEMK